MQTRKKNKIILFIVSSIIIFLGLYIFINPYSAPTYNNKVVIDIWNDSPQTYHSVALDYYNIHKEIKVDIFPQDRVLLIVDYSDLEKNEVEMIITIGSYKEWAISELRKAKEIAYNSLISIQENGLKVNREYNYPKFALTRFFYKKADRIIFVD